MTQEEEEDVGSVSFAPDRRKLPNPDTSLIEFESHVVVSLPALFVQFTKFVRLAGRPCSPSTLALGHSARKAPVTTTKIKYHYRTALPPQYCALTSLTYDSWKLPLAWLYAVAVIQTCYVNVHRSA